MAGGGGDITAPEEKERGTGEKIEEEGRKGEGDREGGEISTEEREREGDNTRRDLEKFIANKRGGKGSKGKE